MAGKFDHETRQWSCTAASLRPGGCD